MVYVGIWCRSAVRRSGDAAATRQVEQRRMTAGGLVTAVALVLLRLLLLVIVMVLMVWMVGAVVAGVLLQMGMHFVY